MAIKKFHTGILVKDNMVEIMKKDGIVVHYRTLNDEEYIKAIRNKIQEEAKELAEETDRDSLIREMADLQEVMSCLQKVLNISDEEVAKARESKYQERGSFDKRHFTEYLEIDENNPVIDYYLNKPDKYPIIE